ncbi:MAG: hypothetical protein CO088_04045 [Candidatus Yonathbacteria bacterium CG_4_9_14_0_8_um_filter_46_47]|uniref:DUF8128 domain-containing protein n=2 Tax=Parcubacteria group TaxID=1794811 RepID=A0A2M8D5U3_9BACT|nr:MAG: hypothetical protein CO088_04045 [Candidatus Yonathbacteria bacterium CG_4_9_14_0_8_um_filter_46_47]
MFDTFIQLYIKVLEALSLLFSMAEYWLPVAAGLLFWSMWMRYIQLRYITAIKWVILEVKLPRQIDKTPLAMEVVLNALYQTSEGKWHEKYLVGRLKSWFSLEMVSLEGSIHFFIRTPAQFKNVIEAQIYAQYTSAEIHEVPDYARYVNYTKEGGEWSLWGTEYVLTKEDAYPIKTYVDYGLDKLGIKEEYKTDPLTSTLEFLGSIGKNEQVWIQIFVQPSGKRKKKPGTWFGKRDWIDEGKELIEKIIKNAKKRSGNATTSNFVTLTKVEEKEIEAIQHSIGKLGFDCGIRAIYWAKDGTFNPSNIPALAGTFRQYTSNDLNGFKPKNTTSFDYPWQDYGNIRLSGLKSSLFNAYKQRSYFYAPFKKKPFVLNSEELATIYHFPGGVAETPTFGRIDSRKAGPPPNLPI